MVRPWIRAPLRAQVPLLLAAALLTSAAPPSHPDVHAPRCPEDIITGGSCKTLPCDEFRNATCNGYPHYQCICKPPLCNVGGECVQPGECAKSTQAGCWWLSPCPEDQECVSNHFLDGYCVCKKGCAKDGVCIDEDVFFGRKDSCHKDTNGTCTVDTCHTYRNATCEGSLLKSCHCDPPHTCAIDGECVRPGECPKHIKTYCGDGEASACQAHAHTRCLSSHRPGDGQCVCDDDLCALNDACVSKEVYFKAHPEEQTGPAALSMPALRTQEPRTLGVVGLASLSLLSALLLVRRRPERPGAGYVAMPERPGTDYVVMPDAER